MEKIASKVAQVQHTGNLNLAEAQEIHGLLNFATEYFAGRSLKYCCFKVFSLVDKGNSDVKQLRDWCEEVLVLLKSIQPRTIPLSINTRTVLVFTDGSWEGGVGGLGAVLLDESSGSRVVVQDKVQENLLKGIVGDQLICQIELLAMVLVRWQWKTELHNRRVLLFVDNNSARGGTVKGRSNSSSMDDLVKAFYSIEVHLPSFWWTERVPSKSNPAVPADEPSRMAGSCNPLGSAFCARIPMSRSRGKLAHPGLQQ